MSKYIIKNCEQIHSSDNFCWSKNVLCQDCTDCVMKQIVELCKKEIRVYRNTILPNEGTNTFHFGRQSFAYDILQMLDIEEINPKIKRSQCPYGGIDCAWCAEECE